MPHRRRSTALRSLLVATVAIVATAGACQQEWEGPLPPPEELGADPLPDRPGGIDAVYATLMGEGGNGSQCYRVLAFAPDGVVETSSVCTAGPVTDALGQVGDPIEVGDYSYRDGTVRIRLVWWDPLAEELMLDEFDASVCGTELRTGSSFELVAGGTPPGAPRCPTP